MDLAGVAWRKSSFSGSQGNGSGCVEVGLIPGGPVALRDTKDRARPAHRYSADQWRHFLAAVRAGEFGAG
ncbi:MAG TPA: DUF397 domain-containing protein [Pseudonocardia sp.]